MNSLELSAKSLANNDLNPDLASLTIEQLNVEQLRQAQLEPVPSKSDLENVHRQRWHDHIRDCKEILRIVEPVEIAGRITKLTGLVMEAAGIKLPIGSACFVPLAEGRRVEAEVVGFDGERMLLMPQSSVDGVMPGAKVFALEVAEALPKPHHGNPPRRRVTDRARHLPVGNELLGRVVDGAGNPLDDLGKIESSQSSPLNARPMNPLMRAPIEEVLDVGVRAINSMLTVGRGQRMGLFAGSGVGKSVLLGMMARYTTADVIVVGLIGERGREVQEFIEQILGPVGYGTLCGGGSSSRCSRLNALTRCKLRHYDCRKLPRPR